MKGRNDRRYYVFINHHFVTVLEPAAVSNTTSSFCENHLFNLLGTLFCLIFIWQYILHLTLCFGPCRVLLIQEVRYSPRGRASQQTGTGNGTGGAIGSWWRNTSTNTAWAISPLIKRVSGVLAWGNRQMKNRTHQYIFTERASTGRNKIIDTSDYSHVTVPPELDISSAHFPCCWVLEWIWWHTRDPQKLGLGADSFSCLLDAVFCLFKQFSIVLHVLVIFCLKHPRQHIIVHVCMSRL